MLRFNGAFIQALFFLDKRREVDNDSGEPLSSETQNEGTQSDTNPRGELITSTRVRGGTTRRPGKHTITSRKMIRCAWVKCSHPSSEREYTAFPVCTHTGRGKTSKYDHWGRCRKKYAVYV